jgi:KDO2-lipid IV(A) lauroyltransferase
MKEKIAAKSEAPWPATVPEKILFGILYIPSFLILHSPRRFQLFLGDQLGDLAYFLAKTRKQVVDENLQRAFPELSASERVELSKKHFRHLGKMLIEYLWSPALRRKDLDRLFVMEGKENFAEALKQGKGAFLLGSHIGSGDISIIMTHLSGFPLHLIGKRTKIHWVTRLLFGLREIHGVTALPEESAMLSIFRALKKNEIVIFVLDQFMGPPVGIETQFFGHETGTALGLAIFAEKTKAPVLQVWNYRDDDGRIHIVVEKPLSLNFEGPRDEVHQALTQKFTDEIERTIRLKPEQWFWVHKRWKPFVRN